MKKVRLRQGESHSSVHSPSPGLPRASEEVRRKVKSDRATTQPDYKITATVGNHAGKSADSNGAKTNIKIDDASRRSHAHVKHRASDRQSSDVAETVNKDHPRKLVLFEGWAATSARVFPPPPQDRAMR